MFKYLRHFIFKFRYYFSPSFSEEFKKIFRFSKKLIIFDVGSYHGQFIEEINFIDENKCDFHLFEPIEKDFKILQNKFKEKNNFYTNNIAISDSIDEKYFYDSAIPTLSTFDKSKNYDKINLNIYIKYLIFKLVGFKNLKLNKLFNKIKISSITLKKYCENRNIKKINILKLDTEGHELNCLIGAGEMLNYYNIDVIQLEIISKSAIDKINQEKKIKDLLTEFKFLKEKKHNQLFYLFSNLKVYDQLYINKKIKF